MIDEVQAAAIARLKLPESTSLDEQSVRELGTGWFFPFVYSGEYGFGAPRGIVINKSTGHALLLGSGALIDRELALYDAGFYSEHFDLVVTAVHDMTATVRLLLRLGLSVVEPTFQHGTVWRIPRPLSALEVRTRLEQLPAVFGDLSRMQHAEGVAAARDKGVAEFEVLERAT